MSSHSLLQLVPNRVAAAVQRLKEGIWQRQQPLTLEATVPTPDYISRAKAGGMSLQPVTQAETWGRLYDQRWWRVRLPSATGGYLEWRDQAEATLYHGELPFYGFDVAHRYCALPEGASELWVESICVQTGIWHEEATGLSAAGSRFEGAWLAQRDEDCWHAFHDLACLFDLLLSEHPGGPKLSPIGRQLPLERVAPSFRRLLRILDQAVDELDRGGPASLRRYLAAAYTELSSSEPSMRAVLTGHAHLDLVWLWPERVGEIKAVHTFATANRLMDDYPEFRFAHSQAATYEAVERRSPELFAQLKSRIAAGNWQATGALYVESDTQLPCGEGLARALIMGQSVFTHLRGSAPSLVWLPDAFGYSSCLPQLMQLSGVSYFFTNKVSWSAVNHFPVSSFIWRGSDGSEVLAHVLQDVGYNGTVLPEELKRAAAAHMQSDVHPEVLYPTGYGDGGGGPTEQMCERARRLASLRGLPAVSWDQPEAFFDRLARHRADLPVYAGEFYLEYHRGTYTTHGDLKLAFRALERALQVREAAAVVTNSHINLDAEWRRMVFAQFHDYIPGSSIPDVYREGIPELQQLAKRLLRDSQDQLGTGTRSCIFNPLTIARTVLLGDRLLRIPPLAGFPVEEAAVSDPPGVIAGPRSLDNGRVLAVVDAQGWLSELVIEGERIALHPGSGSLTLYADRAANFESWDIDRQVLNLGVVAEAPAEIDVEISNGGLRGVLSVQRKIGHASSVTQRYILDSESPMLRVELEIEWHEPETLLKLHFRTGYHDAHVRCGAPFGSILRPQQPGPLAAEAMWEVPASRWITCGRFFIVTEAKYGFSCRNGDLGVSLLRSPRMTGFEAHASAYPRGLSRIEVDSPYSDQGSHRIALAIGRYEPTGPWDQHPAALADSLFTPTMPYNGGPLESPLKSINGGQSLIPCWAQPLAEGTWVLRLHEVQGQHGSTNIDLSDGWSAQKVDLLGQPREAALRNGESLSFRPFEIVSVQISRTQVVQRRDSSWNGFYREDFEVDGRACTLVRPHSPLPGRPWIWRTEFFDAFASVDQALVQAGFHLAYMNVQNMYGSPRALDLMDDFYAYLVSERSLAEHPVLEGFSRGALFALNWAIRHPRRPACLYLDAPVCDFRSWPGGRGAAAGSPDDWELLKQAYGLDEAAALSYSGNPVDNLAPLVEAGVGIIAVYGDADIDLPPAENILLLHKRYAALGGDIVMLPKPGVGHHPHSLLDPQPIVRYILERAL